MLKRILAMDAQAYEAMRSRGRAFVEANFDMSRNIGRSRSSAHSGFAAICSSLGAHSSTCAIVKPALMSRLRRVPSVRCCLITPSASQFVRREPSFW